MSLTEPEIQDLSDLARRVHGDYGTEAAAIKYVLAYVGLRPGELCALRSWMSTSPMPRYSSDST